MKYRHVGRCGLKVSELSFGSWVTFGTDLDLDKAKLLMRKAFDRGVNFFDNAEVYGHGVAEEMMGRALKDYRREDVVVSTKLFWGGNGPNEEGLSRKHLLEGINRSLRRLDLEYVDILYCHRPDPMTPISETVRAMDHIIRKGQALYWGTSEWSATEIRRAYAHAKELGCYPPIVEQPEYNLFHRERVEEEYQILYERHGMGTTTWSPLLSGVLTGKYNEGIPEGSRLQKEEWLGGALTEERIEKVRALTEVARSLDCSMAQLAIAFCLCNQNVSSVILGATSVEQLDHNLQAAEFAEKITPEVMETIDQIVAS